MPAIAIVPSKSPTHVKGSLGEMPNLTSGNPPAATPAPAKPAAPAPAPAAAPPAPAKTAAAPPVPPPLEVTQPAPRKVQREILDKLRNRNAEPAKPAEVDQPMPGEHIEDPDAVEKGKQAAPAEEPADPAEAPDPELEQGGAKTVEGKTAKGGTSPWKLVNEYKDKLKQAEAQLLETRKLIKDEAQARAEQERLESVLKRNQELEEEIKYVNYQKHPEFQEKYEQPYINAVKKAMQTLRGLTVETEDGSREIAAQDVIELVNIDNLREAKTKATELFGDFADDVMLQRNKIRDIWDARVEALANARKQATVREQQLSEQRTAQQTELQNFARQSWEKLNEATQADPENGEFFRTVEGDEERNTVLAKGFELVDTAARGNPLDPSLSPDQRLSIIRKHVAIRNRAAAYGVIKHELKKLRSALAEANEKLKQYEESVPPIGGSSPAAGAAPSGRATDQVFAELRRRARH